MENQYLLFVINTTCLYWITVLFVRVCTIYQITQLSWQSDVASSELLGSNPTEVIFIHTNWLSFFYSNSSNPNIHISFLQNLVMKKEQ